MTFTETGLRPELLSALADIGFEQPTPIQAEIIPLLLEETQRDLVALAQTGTGKTAAFGLPLLHRTDAQAPSVQTLVLCPTRELCNQIAGDLESFAKQLPGVRVVAVYGGASMDTQIRALKRGAQIVVGTPGRVHDMIRRKKLIIDQVRHLVLDEADEMLSMGFKDELEAIIGETPAERQTLLFSATMPDHTVKNFVRDPLQVSVGTKNAGADTVQHRYYVVNARDRYLALKRIVDVHPSIYGIIFCRTRMETKDVAAKLGADGYNADALHGDLSQPQRDYVMGQFRDKTLQLLVATDVAARGIDVNDLTHVINYNLPDDPEVYTHRSGRTGRAGQKGTSIAIIHRREMNRIRGIERVIKKQFVATLVPTGREVCENQLFHLVDKVQNVEVDHEQIDSYLPAIYKKLEALSREDLIKQFVSAEFNRFLDYYKDAPDLNVTANEKKERAGKRDREQRGGNPEFSKFFINVGSHHKLSPARLMGLINEQTPKKGMAIGKIDITDRFAIFEADARYEKDLLRGFKKGVTFEGQPVHVELTQVGPSPKDEKRRFNGDFHKKKKFKKGKKRVR
jgi:ATP-dependent RNA helicase DeaD